MLPEVRADRTPLIAFALMIITAHTSLIVHSLHPVDKGIQALSGGSEPEALQRRCIRLIAS